jgi:hypothetical protein
MKRIKTKAVAEILGVTPETVRAYARDEWIVRLPTCPEPGRKEIWYFDAGEVEAFARGGAKAAEAYRRSVGPKAAPKRGRRVGAK